MKLRLWIAVSLGVPLALAQQAAPVPEPGPAASAGAYTVPPGTKVPLSLINSVSTSSASALVNQMFTSNGTLTPFVNGAATGTAASDVLSNARELDNQSGKLRGAVDEFLTKVRAA